MTPKSRIGKDEIFKDTSGPEGEAPFRGSSIENKLTVILPPDQVDFLDRLCLNIRVQTRKKIRRSEVVRAIVAGVRDSGVDFNSFGGEAELAAEICRRLKG